MIDITEYIPVGIDSTPVSRERLANMTGLSDRKVRDLINGAKQEVPIINVGFGYYIADDPDDPNLKAYIIQEKHRIREISRALKRHKQLYRINKQQEMLDI